MTTRLAPVSEAVTAAAARMVAVLKEVPSKAAGRLPPCPHIVTIGFLMTRSPAAVVSVPVTFTVEPVVTTGPPPGP